MGTVAFCSRLDVLALFGIYAAWLFYAGVAHAMLYVGALRS